MKNTFFGQKRCGLQYLTIYNIDDYDLMHYWETPKTDKYKKYGSMWNTAIDHVKVW